MDSIGMTRRGQSANNQSTMSNYDHTKEIDDNLYHALWATMIHTIKGLSKEAYERTASAVNVCRIKVGLPPHVIAHDEKGRLEFAKAAFQTNQLVPDTKSLIENCAAQEAHSVQCNGSWNIFFATVMQLYSVIVTFFAIVRVSGNSNNFPFALYFGLFIFGAVCDGIFGSIGAHTLRVNNGLVPSARSFLKWFTSRAWLSSVKYMICLLIACLGLLNVQNANNQLSAGASPNLWDSGWLASQPWFFFAQLSSYTVLICLFATELMAFIMSSLEFVFKPIMFELNPNNQTSAVAEVMNIVKDAFAKGQHGPNAITGYLSTRDTSSNVAPLKLSTNPKHADYIRGARGQFGTKGNSVPLAQQQA